MTSKRGVKPINRLPMLLAVLILFAACGGPKVPINIGVKDFPTEVLLGALPQEPQPPPPSLGPVVGFPGFVQPPPPTIQEPEIPAPACPDAHPFDAPRLPAVNRSVNPPTPAEYVFRNTGSFQIGGPEPRSGVFPATTTRRIQNVVKQENEYSFDVVIAQSDSVTTTSYRVVPHSLAPPAINNPPDSGIFITRILTEQGGRDPELFAPTPAIPILLFPAGPGVQWEARGIDPISQTVMQFRGVVTGKTRVDACGTPLDAWNVSVTEGRITGPDKDLSFNATYAIGTQFGGFSLSERVEMSGVDGAETLNSVNQATIMSEPKDPRGGASAQ